MLPNEKQTTNLNSNKLDDKVISDLFNVKKRRLSESEGLMDVKDSIVSKFSALYLSPKFSDISIKVGNETISCHKSILGSQSDFFDRLFESQMLESTQNEIELKETDPRLFCLLLKLSYFGQIDFQQISPKDIIKLYGLIQRYQFSQFEEPFRTKIQKSVNETNIWQMFDTSIEIHSTDCLDICLMFLDKCIDSSIFQSQHFLQISIQTLKTLLSRNSLLVPEIVLFKATAEWLKNNSDLSEECLQQVICCLRLTLIKYEDLMSIVSKSGFVSQQILWKILEDKALIQNWETNSKYDRKDRAFVVYDTDLCCDEFKFEVIEGRVGNKTAESVLEPTTPQIVVRFGFPFIINYIEIKLSDKKGDRFSYKIEYSLEGLVWTSLYDYTNYTTANFQRLFFEPIVSKQFRICGTHQLRMDANTKTHFDSIESFVCHYDKKQLTFKVDRIEGLLSNSFWIRTCVQQRVYHDSNNTNGEQNPIKYYSRQLSSNKPIIVALDQPVMIDSFQFLLWDWDERAYSYVVEVKDRNEWIKVADKSLEKCRSLQTITFNRRPISLVRVRGIQIYFCQCNEFRVIKFNFPRI